MKSREDTTMKKFMTDIKMLAALFIAGVAMTACSSDDNFEQPAEPTTPKTCTLTVNATKGDDATTRALALDESGVKNELNATWTAGDKVVVYYMHPRGMGEEEIMYTPTQIGTLEAQSSGESTTFTGEITTTGITIGGVFGGSSETHDLTTGDKLYLSYSGTLGEGLQPFSQKQDGSLQTLANYFDYAGADVTVSSVSGSTVSINEASAQFENLSYIVRFTLKDKAGNAISPSKLVIQCQTTGEYPVVATANIDIPDATYTANGAGVVFVQLPQTNQTTGFSGNITLTATVGNDTYTYTKSGVTFTNGEYYEITVKMLKQAATGHALSESVVGDVVGTDGKAYAVADKDNLPTGVTAVAMVAYKNETGGLAISLTDAIGYSVNFSQATGTYVIPTWAAAHPITGGEWRLPSAEDWQYMMWGSYNQDRGSESISTFQTNLGAVGEALVNDGYYWTSTVVNDANAKAVYYKDGLAHIYDVSKANNWHIRACLAF
ncbi:MAG: hypothetical protein IKM79_03470 [Bacteroidales bacterium]|nr:hypothetical protein [Bacteroidales bacterium]